MDLATWMRSFTIRTRMQGAIVMVLLMFAALGLTGLLGGRQLMALNVDVTTHGLSDLRQLSATMHEIVSHVQKVSDMIGAVAEGAADPSARIGQINAADSLRQQLQLLTGALAQFRLGGQG